MIEDKEKILVYLSVGIIILLLLIVVILIWSPMFSNESNKEITSVNRYDDGFYVNNKKEIYKNLVIEYINEDNFETTYSKLNMQYNEKIGMSKEQLKEYLQDQKILTHPTNSLVIYCSQLRSNGKRYVYTYVYKIGDIERKIHIIEDYYEDYTISFEQDSYPVVDNENYNIIDSTTGLEFNIHAIDCYEENIIYEIEIINNTTEEYTFNTSSIDDSSLIYNYNGSNITANLSSVVVGAQNSEFKLVPGSTTKVKLSYGINIDRQENVAQIWFNNVTSTNGDNVEVKMILK